MQCVAPGEKKQFRFSILIYKPWKLSADKSYIFLTGFSHFPQKQELLFWNWVLFNRVRTCAWEIVWKYFENYEANLHVGVSVWRRSWLLFNELLFMNENRSVSPTSARYADIYIHNIYIRITTLVLSSVHKLLKCLQIFHGSNGSVCACVCVHCLWL